MYSQVTRSKKQKAIFLVLLGKTGNLHLILIKTVNLQMPFTAKRQFNLYFALVISEFSSNKLITKVNNNYTP